APCESHKEGPAAMSTEGQAITADPGRIGQRLRDSLLRWDIGILVIFMAVVFVGGQQVEGFLTPFYLDFRLVEGAPTLLMALPMTLIIVSGEIDLSVASMLGLSSTLMGVLYRAGLPLSLVVVICLVLGAAMGAVNGLLVTVLGLPALAVTIGTLALYRGLA